MDRTSFYEWKRRFQTHGLEDLKDLAPIHKSHPQTTPAQTVKKIIDFALKNPSKGCVYISNQLKLAGISVSSPTVQKILIRNDIASRYDRWLKLEEKYSNKKIKLSVDQIRHIESLNPCFRERRIESKKPGELLCQDTFLIGVLKGVGKVYMQAIIDSYGSYAFGYLHVSKYPEHCVVPVHNEVLLFYKNKGLLVKAILTDNGREYCGPENHPYELYLSLNDIEHRKTKIRRPQSNGFVERFNRTALDEFFRPAFRKKHYAPVPKLQRDFDIWLEHYNTQRTHQGYRNMGKRPIDTINKFCKNKLKHKK